MSQDHERPDPEDMFAHTRMSLGDHIDELRTCLISAFKGFFLCLIIGFIVAEPVLALIKYPVERQLHEFYDRHIRDEKKYVHIFLPFSLGLFMAGVAVCQFLVLPWGIHWLLEFSHWIKVEPELRLSEWLSFAILMPVLFGVGFQLPLVMLFLYKIDVI